MTTRTWASRPGGPPTSLQVNKNGEALARILIFCLLARGQGCLIHFSSRFLISARQLAQLQLPYGFYDETWALYNTYVLGTITRSAVCDEDG